jgi:hypothetical protein
MTAIQTAFNVLSNLEKPQWPNIPPYRNPHLVLTALLQHAPFEDGKIEIARDVLAAPMDDHLAQVAHLTTLADYFLDHLLIPCIHPLSHSSNCF